MIAMKSAAGVIQCHTCGEKSQLVRSVKIRQWIGPFSCGEIPCRTEIEAAQCAASGIEGVNGDVYAIAGDGPESPQYQQFRKCMQFRTAFVCLDCYRTLDNCYGIAAIPLDGKFRLYGLAGTSRRDKATVYNYAKWLAYQNRMAAKMGISVPS
jgi:hypothetical protein